MNFNRFEIFQRTDERFFLANLENQIKIVCTHVGNMKSDVFLIIDR
jgi:hypothetical protein